MLAKANRLPSYEIPNIMRSGKRVCKNGITLVYMTQHSKPPSQNSRFCFIVSTKIDKRATVRNRMRRILSESVRNLLSGITTQIDGALIGSKLVIGKTQLEVQKDVQEMIHEAHNT